jgi:hypothetical protein
MSYTEPMDIGTMGQSGPATAGDLISRGEQMLQIRTKSQLMVAVQRPRNLDKFAAKMQAMAAQAGDDFYYSIPYKNHKKGCRDRYNCDCPSQPVEGPGVGLARAGAAEWGNCAMEVRIEAETENEWLIRADWIDFENNFSRSEVKRVSKLKPAKGGGYYKASDKDLDNVYQIGASKVERDCILRALPRYIIEACFQTAKAAALAEKAPIPTQINRLLQKFKEMDVTVDMIERLIRCPFSEKGLQMADKSAASVCAHLRGILTALRGGEITVEEIFGAGTEPEPDPPNAGGTSTPSPATGAAAEVPGVHAGSPAAVASPPPAPKADRPAPAKGIADPLQNSTRSHLMGLAGRCGCKGEADVPQANGAVRKSTTIVLDDALAERIGRPGQPYVPVIELSEAMARALIEELEIRQTDGDAGAALGSGN